VNLYGWEWTTITALIAPRPMLFANSDNDRIFPMDGNRRIIARLREAYRMLGKPELVDEYVSKGGHDYRPDLRVAIFQWINKHLKNDTGPVKDAEFTPLPGKELRVFAEDADSPKDSVNDRIDETFVPTARVKLPEAGKFEEWKDALMRELRSRPFRSFPDRIPAADSVAVAGFTSNRIVTEPEVNAKLHISRDDIGNSLVLQAQDGSDPGGKISGWRLMTRGIHEFAWSRRSPPNYVERSHALLGRTTDTGRVWDIVGAFRYLNKDPLNPVVERLVGSKQDGICAAYAAIFEPSIKEVVIYDPPTSHRDGPHFLGVLRVLDIPDALGLLAPRPLTLVGAKDKAFDRTAAIYEAAGAAGKLTRK
jgi:hypothetical protein